MAAAVVVEASIVVHLCGTAGSVALVAEVPNIVEGRHLLEVAQ
jgi:hypothetical protein